MFNRLATLVFLKRSENIIITGASGVGKSFIAQALGHKSCFEGVKVMYSNTARLFAKLKLSKADGTYIRELQKLQKVNLLILDD
ncbi:MAG: ATP-binding protein, partial [Desulfitobacteriaceae bacterium]|nr:ATP-binding protein [Desulfitobacteriaceae bacterium]